MSHLARLGVFCLMGLAILLARLVEVEFQPEPLAAAVAAPGEAAGADEPEPSAEPEDELEAAPPPRPDALERTYIVRAGDNLGAISQKVYGTTRHWQRIQDANRDVIPDPRRMRPGVRLRIPDLEQQRAGESSR